jgi:hypothetical protein
MVLIIWTLFALFDNIFHVNRIEEEIIEAKLLEYRASLVQKDAEEGKGTTTYETDEYGRIV